MVRSSTASKRTYGATTLWDRRQRNTLRHFVSPRCSKCHNNYKRYRRRADKLSYLSAHNEVNVKKWIRSIREFVQHICEECQSVSENPNGIFVLFEGKFTTPLAVQSKLCEKFTGGVVEREIRLSSYVPGDLFNIDLKKISHTPYTIYRNYCSYQNIRWTPKGKLELKIPIAKKLATAQFGDYLIPTTEYISFETPQYDFVDCFNNPLLLDETIGLNIYDILIQNALPFKESGPIKLFYNQLNCRLIYEEETIDMFHYDPIYQIKHSNFLTCLKQESFQFRTEPLQETQCIELNRRDLFHLIQNRTDQCFVALKWDGTRCHIHFDQFAINIICYDGRLFSLKINSTQQSVYEPLYQLYHHVWFIGEYLVNGNKIILIDVAVRTQFHLRLTILKSLYRNFVEFFKHFHIYIQMFVPFSPKEKQPLLTTLHRKLIKFWQKKFDQTQVISKSLDGMIISFATNSLQYKIKYISSIDLLWFNNCWYLADGIQFGINLNNNLIQLNSIVLENNCIYEVNILSKNRWIVNRSRKDKQQPNKIDILYNILKIYYL